MADFGNDKKIISFIGDTLLFCSGIAFDSKFLYIGGEHNE
jgi:uncharacterized membrane protein SirB2